MKTRFDYAGVWITGYGEAVPVDKMETAHLLNTVKMLVRKPARVLSILISDIENATFSETVWTAHNTNDKKQSLNNVTSMSETELVEYAANTPLFNSMLDELKARGVNVENIMILFGSSEGFKS